MIGKLKCLCISVLILLLCASAAYAKTEPLVKEYPFKSKTAKFTYEAPQTISENGKTYKLTNTEYQLVSKPKITKTVKTYTGLTEKKVPKTTKKNGKKLALEKVSWTENRRNAITGSTTFEGYDSRPDTPETKNITGTLPNGRQITVTGHLQSLEQIGSSYSKPFAVTAKFIGDKDVAYYKLGDTRIPNNPKSPAFDGYEKVLLQHLGYDPEHYKITNGKWTTDYQKENGQSVRYAEFSGTRQSLNWTATYTETLTASSPELLTYNATATYSNAKDAMYQAKAVCTYEKESHSLIPIMIGIGVGVLILAFVITIILQIIKKKRGEQDENSN